MSSRKRVPLELTLEVRDTCYCLHLQRAARVIARRFDDALRPFDLTNGQFSLLMALNSREPTTIGRLSSLLAMDRTTVTANLKPLERRGLAKLVAGSEDGRQRHPVLTDAGHALLLEACPIWKQTELEVEQLVPAAGATRLRGDLRALAGISW